MYLFLNKFTTMQITNLSDINMKSFLKSYLIIGLFLFFGVTIIQAQDIEVISHETFVYDTVGSNTDITFHIEVINHSAQEQIVFLVRTINDLPFPEPEWTSALCFGELCFPSFIDSVATDGGANPPLALDDTLFASLHVYPQSGIGTGYIQIQIGTFLHPNDRYTLNFTATTDPTMDVNEADYFNSYFLSQNYPNPFNPATKISYKIGEPGFVQLKVYNVLGVEVKSLINEFKISGEYSINFNASSLSSGVYFYTLSINNFTQTRKMILEK